MRNWESTLQFHSLFATRYSLFALVFGAMMLGSAAVSARDSDPPVAVDLELVLAVDVSNSIDAGENALQRAGYVNALRHPYVWAAIRTGRLQRIAVTYFEWAGPERHRTVLPWLLIDSAEAAREAARRLAEPRIMFTRGTGTSISAALRYGAGLFAANGFDGSRQVIDISGDGPNNRGGSVTAARDAVVSEGITINGLPLMLRPSRTFARMDVYYRDCVIGGDGPFLLPVYGQDQMALAIRYKLILEIAENGMRDGAPVPVAVSADAADCGIGDAPPR